jgi:glyoxylase-like metal-dependent hydrolase (beta-lactamase superfamily II)
MSETVAPGVLEVDTLLGGWKQTTAGYLLTGPNPVLVETGSQTSVPVILNALKEAGLGPNDLSAVLVTHIHLDHAGGVGDVAAAFPAARVYVHERGARHLIDPSRLVASASLVYGELLDTLYGRLEPTPADRVHVLYDGDTVDIGDGRTLMAIDSPGHAKHHLGFLDSESGLLFAGDAVGVKLPGGGALRPATPPPDFDLDQALNSLRRFAEASPQRIALAHYGIIPTDPDLLLTEAAETLSHWAEEAERAFNEGEDIAGALASRFAEDLSGVDPQQRERLETLNGIHSNAAGLQRWLTLRREHEAGDHSH